MLRKIIGWRPSPLSSVLSAVAPPPLPDHVPATKARAPRSRTLKAA